MAENNNQQDKIEVDPRDPSAHSIIAWFYKDQGKLDLAEQEFKAAIEVDPRRASFHYDLARLYNYQDKLDLAEQEYKAAIEVDPRDPSAHSIIAWFYKDQGKLDLAEQEFKAAIEINPRGTSFRYVLARLYTDQDKLDLAEQEYKAAIEFNPHDTSAHYIIAEFYKDQGKLDLAEQEFKAAIEINPSDTMANYGLRNLYVGKGKTKLAIAEYKEVIELSLNDISSYFDLVAIYPIAIYTYYKDSIIEAKKSYEESRQYEIDPDNCYSKNHNKSSLFLALYHNQDSKFAKSLIEKGCALHKDDFDHFLGDAAARGTLKALNNLQIPELNTSHVYQDFPMVEEFKSCQVTDAEFCLYGPDYLESDTYIPITVIGILMLGNYLYNNFIE